MARKRMSQVRIVQRTETLDSKGIISAINTSFGNIDASIQNIEESINKFIAANRSTIVEETLSTLVDLNERGNEVSEQTNTILKEIKEDLGSVLSSKTEQKPTPNDSFVDDSISHMVSTNEVGNGVLREIKAELISGRLRQERISEEQRLESLDERKKHIQILERIEDLLSKKITTPKRETATNREGLPSWLGTLALFPLKMLVGLIRALP